MNCISVVIFICGLFIGVVRGEATSVTTRPGLPFTGIREGPIYGLPFNGELILYDGAYYDKRFATINFKRSSRCYQLNCSNLDNRVASARWSGLPTRGGFQYYVNISFYANANCEGYQETFILPHNGGVREFISKKVKGSISSFLVKEDSPKASSYESVCNEDHDVNASVSVTAH
ncbi:hypothetical protein P3T76_014148 [Phytophthora citrophthora]|uniref:Uncharacterized protein n=1 Tax=Phytophthora citrophthora TaxID=4793 RepID=A0AAD9G302_9STRA|nr:hypothetical protein P3T76_014148 [Phytophthora citrophthora]